MKNPKITSASTDQIHGREHQEDHDARRVFVVGGNFNIKANLEQPQAAAPIVIKEIEFKEIEKVITINTVETKIERIEVPVIIPSIQFVDRVVVVKEVEFKEVIKHVPIVETKIETIEKIVYRDVKTSTNVLYIILFLQTLAIVGIAGVILFR